MSTVRRVLATARGLTPDVLALAGLGCVAYGFAQTPGGWGAVLGPLSLGLGLIAVVRFGAR